MKTQYKILFFLFGVILFVSCKEDNYITNSSAGLEFSVDTVSFDTVFTTIGSVTKHLKVYNRHNQPIKIESIELAKQTENFRLNIDGVPTNDASHIKLRANDSMYIFVEVTVDPVNQSNPMVIQDSLVFTTNGNIQDIDLIAYGQDVRILNGASLNSQTWNPEKPYLVMNSIVLNRQQKLTILKGTVIHFYRRTGFFVYGTLDIKGTYDEPVIMQGDRLEWMYTDVPGQWDGVFIMPGSSRNVINNAIIKNAHTGIYIDSISNPRYPALEIKNCQLLHHTQFGLFSKRSDVKAYNCVFADCGEHAVAINAGGLAEFYHCTISNTYVNWASGSGPGASLAISNYFYDRDEEVIYLNPLYNAYFANCIIYGDQSRDILFDNFNEVAFNVRFNNCIFNYDMEPQFQGDTLRVDFSNEYNFSNNIINPDSLKFKLIDRENFLYDYNLDTLSIAIDAADSDIIKEHMEFLRYDLEGKDRLADEAPDIGAFEWVGQAPADTTETK